MASPALVASLACLLPAMGLLFLMLRRYEGYFDDRRLFFSLAVGLFAGLVVAALENIAFQFNGEAFVRASSGIFPFAYFVVGYALVESLAKLVVLGSARFRVRKDTPYYGAALGLGLGATLSIQNLALAMQHTGLPERALDRDWLVTFALLLTLYLGAIAAHAATGVWVGKGAAAGKLWMGMLWGSLFQAPIQALRFFPVGGGHVIAWTALAAFAYGLLLMAFTQRRVLDRIVPPEIRDQVRRELRRKLRGHGRDGAESEPPSPIQDEMAR